MTVATNTTEGQVILSGDLTGTGSAPELRASGVVPGTYSSSITLDPNQQFTANVPSIVIDAKGRVTYAVIQKLAQAVSDASTNQKGVVRVGSRLSVNSGVLSFSSQDASNSIKGVTQIGSGLSVTAGVVSLDAPDATTASKGILTAGTGLNVNSGTLFVSPPDATVSSKGVMQAGAGLNAVAGVVSLAAQDATTISKGVVRIGSGLAVNSGLMSVEVPIATTISRGGFKIGTGLSVASGVLSAAVPDATTTSKGLVRPGAGLSLIGTVLQADPITFVDATASVKGVIQIGNGLSVSTGTASIDYALVPSSTTSSRGFVQVGSGFNILSGVLSVPDASNGVKGIMRAGTGLGISSGTISLTVGDTTSSVKGLCQAGSGMSIVDGLLSVDQASILDSSNSNSGLVQVGAGLGVAAGIISLQAPDATSASKGLISADTTLLLSGGEISLRLATDTVFGGVRFGDGFSTPSTPGVLALDGTVIRTATAATHAAGSVRASGVYTDRTSNYPPEINGIAVMNLRLWNRRVNAAKMTIDDSRTVVAVQLQGRSSLDPDGTFDNSTVSGLGMCAYLLVDNTSPEPVVISFSNAGSGGFGLISNQYGGGYFGTGSPNNEVLKANGLLDSEFSVAPGQRKIFEIMYMGRITSPFVPEDGSILTAIVTKIITV